MANFYPIKLTIDPEAWRLFSIRKNDPAFKTFSQKIFERDQYTCGFCGFQAKQGHEIVNLDNNYRNNNPSNLATACCFCTQCFFLEVIGQDDQSGGTVIYLPEITQGDLNGFCHVLFCAMSNATNYHTDAQNIYRGLRLRAKVIEEQFGEGMSDPALLGRTLIDAPDKNWIQISEKILPPLRILPLYTKFSKQVGIWSEKSLEELTAE